MKLIHIVGQSATQFVDPRHESLKVVSVLDPGVFGDFFEPLAFRADQVDPQDGVVVERGQFGGRVA
jgi:hypothetical protein